MMLLRKLIYILVMTAFLAGVFSPASVGFGDSASQPDPARTKAAEMLSRLSPEEKVGQLFLVTFKGTDLGQKSSIYELVTHYHVGGVMLTAQNDNFTGPVGTTEAAYGLISGLQHLEMDSQATIIAPGTGSVVPAHQIPLFVAVSQEGDGPPYNQILEGLTPLPDEMAIGATWNPVEAENVGKVLGKELTALGFNLLFGPSLDVLDMRQTTTGNDLGTRTFGGDPFWVREMGRGYIKGLHEGSNNNLVVIAKNFPGRGGSDRLPEDEVATVRKSLDELKQIELYPFFGVTESGTPAAEVANGLLVSHIRYQGFQGNIRTTTKPVSFDATALSVLMSLPQFVSWREAGGLLVSDDLGSQAVRRWIDPTGLNFDAREVARSAFLAGNDLLYADNFTATADPDAATTVINVLGYFAQKYREDPAFAQRVDASVLRILTQKYRLYPNFSVDMVIPDVSGLDNLGKSENISFEVAGQAVTLISPTKEELGTVLPRPPGYLDRILILTDTVSGRQCSTCVEDPVLGVDDLKNAILKLYGPGTGGQVFPNRIFSYSFSDLSLILKGGAGLPDLEEAFRQADWVIFATLIPSESRPQSMALKRLLDERPDVIQNKKALVFALNAPYYLDATDLSKITAYYGFYSKTPAFVGVAARILFQDLSPQGVLPVSVPGIGYDLNVATQPDPNQFITLSLDYPAASQLTPTPEIVTPEATKVPTFKVGDTIPLRTSVIVDHNNKPVPDNTVATFIITTGGEQGTVQQVDAVTTQGLARATYRIEKPGLVQIRVVCEPAKNSTVIKLDISGGQSAIITEIVPTAVPSATPTSTLTPVPPTPTPTPTPAPKPVEHPTFNEWLLALIASLGASALIYVLSARWTTLQWSLRWGLCALAGGLLAYLILTTGIPGVKTWLQSAGMRGVLEITFMGIGLGWAAGVAWQVWERSTPGGKV